MTDTLARRLAEQGDQPAPLWEPWWFKAWCCGRPVVTVWALPHLL